VNEQETTSEPSPREREERVFCEEQPAPAARCPF
jgi:hypothetical protein